MINDKEFYGAEFSDNPATTKRHDSVIPLLVEWLFSLCELDLVGASAGRFEHRHSPSESHPMRTFARVRFWGVLAQMRTEWQVVLFHSATRIYWNAEGSCLAWEFSKEALDVNRISPHGKQLPRPAPRAVSPRWTESRGR